MVQIDLFFIFPLFLPFPFPAFHSVDAPIHIKQMHIFVLQLEGPKLILKPSQHSWGASI